MPRYTDVKIHKAILAAASKLGYRELRPKQETAVKGFLQGRLASTDQIKFYNFNVKVYCISIVDLYQRKCF